MSIKSKVLAGASALTMVGALGAGALASAGAANAATPSCGNSCLNIFSHELGSFAHPNFVLDAYKRGSSVGTPLILFQASNNDPAEDFAIEDEGTVNEFFAAGLVTSAVDLHYGTDEAFEFSYAPYGADTGNCAGVSATAVAGEKVTLQPCGESSKTLWIVDTQDSAFTTTVPLVNGSDNNFARPYSLTYPSGANPTDMPRPQLYVTNLTGSAVGGGGPELGTVEDTQLWGATVGVLK